MDQQGPGSRGVNQDRALRNSPINPEVLVVASHTYSMCISPCEARQFLIQISLILSNIIRLLEQSRFGNELWDKKNDKEIAQILNKICPGCKSIRYQSKGFQLISGIKKPYGCKYCSGSGLGHYPSTKFRVSSNDLFRRTTIIVEINDTTSKEKTLGKDCRLIIGVLFLIMLNKKVYSTISLYKEMKSELSKCRKTLVELAFGLHYVNRHNVNKRSTRNRNFDARSTSRSCLGSRGQWREPVGLVNELKRNRCGDGRDHQVNLVGSPPQLWIAAAATKQAPSKTLISKENTNDLMTEEELFLKLWEFVQQGNIAFARPDTPFSCIISCAISRTEPGVVVRSKLANYHILCSILICDYSFRNCFTRASHAKVNWAIEIGPRLIF
ncbi:hypothetical protein VNO77_27348 [Canavalia gladiata]|uniref:Uncharacterized protein n=1 Tax=Canavalia gladiata TaxID=3824 RepID=A0AAN9Q6D7_CANGL